MNIKGLEFIKTCNACPEQYDVFDKHHNIVGYVRLRWGSLICKYPNVEGELIYSDSVGEDGWVGMFDSEEQRLFYLTTIADRIIDRIKLDKLGG